MFDTIRKKIRENRLAAAFNDMDKLPMSREQSSRLVNLHRRFRVYQDKAIGNLKEDRLLRIEENGIVEDMLMFLDMVEYPAKDQQGDSDSADPATRAEELLGKQGRTAPARQTGQEAGAESKPQRKVRWLPLLLGALVVLALGVWWLRPTSTQKPVGEATNERVERPERTTPDETGKDPDGTTKPGVSRVPEGKLTIDRELLQRPDLSKVQDIQLDPAVISRTLQRALMTLGPQVDVAVAVYRNRIAPTKYDEALTKSFATFLNGQFTENITYGVLTEVFHDLADRDRIVLKGVMEDSRLSSKRARYLLLVDIRSLKVMNKADYRLCLYDVERQKGLTRGSSVDLGSWTSIKEKDLLYQARDFLKDLKGRGLFQ